MRRIHVAPSPLLCPTPSHSHNNDFSSMAVLVKACRTFVMSDGLAWKDIKHKVEGVKFIDDRRAIMAFGEAARSQKETTLLGLNYSPIVKTCSLFDRSVAHATDEDEKTLVQKLLRASGRERIYVKSSSYDFCVFQVHLDVELDVFRCHERLERLASGVVDEHESVPQRRQVFVVFDREIHDSLVITDNRVVWSISDTVPQKILASVVGMCPSQALSLVSKSRLNIGLF